MVPGPEGWGNLVLVLGGEGIWSWSWGVRESGPGPGGGVLYPSMSCRFPGPLLRGMLRGIWPGGIPRPTPKGEVEGDLVEAHTQGGS